MSRSADDLQKMLEWAKQNNDTEAVEAVSAEIARSEGVRPRDTALPAHLDQDPIEGMALGASEAPDYSPLETASIEQRTGGGALRKPTPEQPWTPEEYALAGERQQKRERKLAQAQYDADQQLISDPATRPNRQQLKEFAETNTDWQFGYGQFDSMQRQVVIDPETGKPRWTALSPDQLDQLDKRGETTFGAIGALAYGSTRFAGATAENIEADQDRLKNFQSFLVKEALPASERDRIMNLARAKYGDKSRYVKNPGLIPSDQLKEWIDQNPDNEQVLDSIAGDEWSSERKEFFKRLGNRASAVIPYMPVNIFGADDPIGDISGRGAFENIEYGEGENAPAYPGASLDLRDWRSRTKRGTGLYEGLVRPYFEGKYEKTPGQAITEGAMGLRDKFYSEEQEAESQMPLLTEDIEIDSIGDLWDSVISSAGDPNTKLGNPESLLLMFLENAPELGFSFAVTRGAGGVAARGAAAERGGQTLATMNKARELAAGRAGMVAGGATEGILVQGHVEAETRRIMEQIPEEVWAENPLFQVYTEAGLTPEEAKQIMAQDAASRAGTTAAAITMITGAPMNRFMARSAAGRLVQSSPGARRTVGALGEPVTEGAQEVMELLQTEAAVRPVDPNNPIFEDPNRYWETGLSAAIVSSPFGAGAALEPSTPQGISEADKEVARATVEYQNKTNERFAFETKITDPEHMANTTPNERLRELEKLEQMQEAEADSLLKAEPLMREHIEGNRPARIADTELRMLNRLKMRANAVKSDIAVARSKRTNAASMALEEKRVLQDRANLQRRVNENIIKLEDIESLTAGIEAVQNQEAVSPEQQEQLISEGYARVTSDDQLVILPKGRRAMKELNVQAANLRSQLESGYTGPERRQRQNTWQREMVHEAGPAQREQVLYTDPLTGTQNRRAFNERQENIDVREGQQATVPEGAQPVVAAVDVDSLAWVNDNMTHSAGDRLLQTISDTLARQKGIEVFRLGGDEFAVTGTSEQAVEEALQKAAAELQEQEIASGEDAVTPQITWGKGRNYVEADTQSIAMKQDRIGRGIVAQRKKKPATYRVKSQQALFQKDDMALARSWNRAKEFAERGDSVEVLTPDGAVQGVVTNVTNRRGRPRVTVNIQGRSFRFNPDKNWLIVDNFLDPADLAWITGEAEYAQPDRETFPQTLSDVQIGHLGKDGAWYADLATDFDYEAPLPWWMTDYQNDGYDSKVSHFVPQLREASAEEMSRAEIVVDDFTGGFANRPKINIVKSMSQLQREAPDVVARIRAEGATLTGVRGYMDHVDPSNGIYIFVPNIYSIAGDQNFEQGIIETVMHEMVGHYGIRGTFGNEADLREVMHGIVDAFPRLARNYSTNLGLNPADPDDKQLLGEEMVAYIAGEEAAGKINMTPKQRNIWQRFLEFIRNALNRMGMNRFSPIKKFDAYAQKKTTSLNDTKVEFWNDKRVQELIYRSQDFLHNGKGFEWRALNGSSVLYMRDADIFRAGLVTAINTGTKKLSRNERNQLKSKYGNDINNVPKEAPLFADSASPNAYKQAIVQAQKQGFMTKRELELSGLDPSSDFYFFRDATYGTLHRYMQGLHGDMLMPDWYKGVVPPAVAAELDAIYEAQRKVFMVGPLPQYGDEKHRPILNPASEEAMRNRIAEIFAQKIDPKKTKLNKELLLAHMSSENVFRVYAEKQGGHPRISYEQAIDRLFGPGVASDVAEGKDKLTPEQEQQIKAEIQRTKSRGYDIGFDEETQRWLDWARHTTEYAEWSPQGSRYTQDFRVALIKTEGMGTSMGYSGHYDKNLMHIRTGVAELVDSADFEGLTFPNPEMQGRLLSLIELQSDWLQKLRKGFGSENDRQAADRQVMEDRVLLNNIGDQFGRGVAEDLWIAIDDVFKPIANLPSDARGDRRGSMFESLRNRTREELGQTWEDATDTQRAEVWKRHVAEELDKIADPLVKAVEYIDQAKADLPQSADLPGTMDARGFEVLDAMAARHTADLIRRELLGIVDASRNNLRYTNSQTEMVTELQEMKRRFGAFLNVLASGNDSDSSLRLPMAVYQMQPILEEIYKRVGANTTAVAERISAIQVREMATIRIPRQVVDDLNRAMQAKYDSVALLGEVFSDSRVNRYSDIAPGNLMMSPTPAGDEFVDIKVVGNKADIQKAKELAPKLIETWVKDHAQEKLDTNKREAARRAASRSGETVPDPGYDWDEIVDFFGMEEADVEEGDSETSANNVTTFYEFEERRMDEYHPEMINEAFENMSESDWDELEGDYEGVSREGSEYRSRIEVDEDGDADTTEAEDYLREQREEYRRDVMWDDDDIRMQAYERIREEWFEDDPPYLAIGSLPVAWDEDGDPTDYVGLMIRAEEPGDHHRVHIDGEEQDYFYSASDAQGAMSEAIASWYDSGDIIPPPGAAFHPEGYVADQEAAAVEDGAKPNWDIAKNNIVDNLSMMSDETQKLGKVYERLVTNTKKLNGRVEEDSPVGRDEQWRPIALKYLISDAVRRGLGGVMWNNGLSSSTRGGMGLQDVRGYDQIAWTKESVSIRGEEQEVYVIHRPGMEKPLVLSKNKMVAALGADATRLINMQEAGKLQSSDVTKTNATPDRDADFDPRDNYIIAQSDNDVQAVYRRANNEFMGFARSEDQIGAIIQQDLLHAGRIEVARTEEGVAPEIKNVGQPIRPDYPNRPTQGVITREMLGSQIFVIAGGRTRGFLHTFSTPKLAGARMSYEDITVRMWNKELKKYGVSIQDTYVKAQNMRKATTEEGQATREDPSRDEKIAEEHGELYVAELTGAQHGWVVMSKKQGPVVNDVFTDRAYADSRLTDYIESNYGTGQEGVRVMYFPITEKMREDFSGPVAPFHYNPEEDPALKSAAAKIGYSKTPLGKRLKHWQHGATATFQQGAIDRFYGLKRALKEAGVDDGSYVSARLTTSLDGQMKAILYHGHPVWKDGIMSTEGRGLAEILAPIMNDPDTWGLYMATKRAKGLMLEGYDKLSPEDKKLIDKAAAHFDGDIMAMMAFAIEYDSDQERDPGTTKGRKRTRADTRKLAQWEKDLDLVKGAKKGSYYNREGRRVPREWLEQEAKGLTEKLVGFSKRAKPPNEDFIEAIREHLRQAQIQLNPDPEITRLENLISQLEWETSPHKKKPKRWAKRDDMMAALHAIDNLVQNGREHLFNASEIRAGVALGDKIPGFKRVAKEYAEFNKRVLDFAEASGLIDKESRPTWENADYVPFYRAEDDRLAGSSMSSTAGIANQKSPIIRLRGKDQKVGDILGNIMMNVTKLVDASVKNNAALESVDALRGSGIIQNKPMEWKPVLISMNQVKKVLIDRGVIVRDDKDGIHFSDIPSEALTGLQKMFAINAPKGDGVISVMRNGKREYYYTDDMLLYRSLAAINKKAFGRWIQMFRQPKRMLTTLITIDPAFMMANFLRDTGSAYVLSRDHAPPVIGALKGFNKALFEDETMRTLMSSGAAFENGFITGGDPNTTRKVLRQAMKSKTFTRTVLDTPFKLGRAWLHLGASIENSNRVAVYQAAIRAGKSKKQAAYEAKDLMDFSMGGDWPAIQFLIQTVPFMNARAQGNYRLYRGATENPKGFAMKGSLIALAGMAVFLAFKDDERYKALEMWDRHAYYHFWIGDNHYRLPKPFEVGAIFNTIPEMFMEYFYSQETDAGKDLMRGFGHMLNETFNMSPIPQTLQPIREARNNINYFTKNPIVSHYEQKRLPPDQYRYRTSPTMIELAKRLPGGLDTMSGKIRSPLHLQNFYAGYTGTIGRYILQGSDMLVRAMADYPLPPSAEDVDWPVWGRFVRGDAPPRRTKYEREVYKLLDKTTAIQGSLNFHEKLGNVDEYLKTHSENIPYIRAASSLESVRENIQEINRAIQVIHMIDNTDSKGKPLPEDHKDYYSQDRKREEINVLEEMRNNIFKQGWKLRPGGELNPGDEPVTKTQVMDMIDNFGVDDSTAFMRHLEESAPDTYELLEIISNDMGMRGLVSLAAAGGNNNE